MLCLACVGSALCGARADEKTPLSPPIRPLSTASAFRAAWLEFPRPPLAPLPPADAALKAHRLCDPSGTVSPISLPLSLFSRPPSSSHDRYESEHGRAARSRSRAHSHTHGHTVVHGLPPSWLVALSRQA